MTPSSKTENQPSAQILQFPELTSEQLRDQLQKIEDLVEEIYIDHQLTTDPEQQAKNQHKMRVLSGRRDKVYRQLIERQRVQTRQYILDTLNHRA